MKDQSDKMYLTPAERIVMRTIWLADHQLVLHEVMNICNEEYKKNWKPQTVSTYLSHLVQKDFLKMHRQGRYCYYEPLVSREEFLLYDVKNIAFFWQLEETKLLEHIKTFSTNPLTFSAE